MDINSPLYQNFIKNINDQLIKPKTDSIPVPTPDPLSEDQLLQARKDALQKIMQEQQDKQAPAMEEPKVSYDTPLTDEELRNRQYLKDKYGNQ